ncbi:HD-GYP domain-containing protein [Thermotoga profunda]|uniref:HD-GYP domain-containing protein n=1 Tax=Thermotoga profunda TaxID=1508420 RepID=UPI001E47CE69|nr:HD-GYP domain-containing protein [Thermotoga profunda]
MKRISIIIILFMVIFGRKEIVMKIVFLGKNHDFEQILKSYRDANHTLVLIKNIKDAYEFFHQHSKSCRLVVIDSNSLNSDYFPLIQLIRKNSSSFVNPYIVIIDNTKSNLALKIGADAIYDQLPDEKELNLLLQNVQFSLNLDAIIEHAVNMMQIKDNPTFEHCRSTAKISSALASLYLQSLAKKDIEWHRNLKIAALLHDTGKILVPESILQKPARLTDEEFKMMKNHTKLGSELFRKVSDISSKEVFSMCAKVCLYHHEKFDGTGYPEGLKGDQIPLEARIVSIADVFDALTSNRHYRSAYTFEKAFQIMKDDEKGHFDPKLLDLFLNNADLFYQMKLESEL